jgi:hypothetical protein
MYLRLKHQLIDLQPDAIIVNVDNTDLYDDWWRYRPQTQMDQQGVPVAAAMRSWRVTEAIKVPMQFSVAARMGFSVAHRLLVWWKGMPSQGIGEAPLPTMEAIDWFHVADPHDPVWRDAFAFLTSNLGRILDLCELRGIRCAITTYPHQGQIDGTQHLMFAERLGEYAQSRGVYFFDAFPAIAEAAMTERLYYTQDMHFNARGFAVWSQAFARDLSAWVRYSKMTSHHSTASH